MTNKTLLQEADALIYGDRQESYGSVTDNFSRIAAGWDQIFKDKLKPGEHITPQEVGLAMAWLKIARYCHKPKRDNLVDVAGYVGCIDKMDHENEEPTKDFLCAASPIKWAAITLKGYRAGVLAIRQFASCVMGSRHETPYFKIIDDIGPKFEQIAEGATPDIAWCNAWTNLPMEERKKYIIQEEAIATPSYKDKVIQLHPEAKCLASTLPIPPGITYFHIVADGKMLGISGSEDLAWMCAWLNLGNKAE